MADFQEPSIPGSQQAREQLGQDASGTSPRSPRFGCIGGGAADCDAAHSCWPRAGSALRAKPRREAVQLQARYEARPSVRRRLSRVPPAFIVKGPHSCVVLRSFVRRVCLYLSTIMDSGTVCFNTDLLVIDDHTHTAAHGDQVVVLLSAHRQRYTSS